MSRHVFLSATPEGAKLNLTYEQEHTLKLVYREDAPGSGRYRFADFWDPETDYPEDCVVVPLRSAFDRLTPYNANAEFANVIGSSREPHKNWKKMLVDNGVNCGVCVTDQAFYKPDGSGTFPTDADFYCGKNPTIVGGHVTTGRVNQEPAEYAAGIMLIPICGTHNTTSKFDTHVSKRTGVGFFMKTAAGGNAALLKDYLHLPAEGADE